MLSEMKLLATLRRLFDSDRLAEVISSLAGNKSRTVLTAFGIFWGVFMLVLLLGGGKGLQSLMMSGFSDFSSNSAIITDNATTKPYKGYSKNRSWKLTIADVAGLKSSVSEISVATPVNFQMGSASYGKRSYSGSTLKGLYPEYFKIESQKIKFGRTINDDDVRHRRKVCVIGKRVWEELFPGGGNPCGKFIKVGSVYYQVVGVDVKKSYIGIGGSSDRSLLIPFSTMSNVYNTGNRVNIIAITGRRGVTMASLETPVRRYVARRHEIAPDDREAMVYFNAESVFQMFDNLFRGINILVWLIGVGTLVSGLIGVTNIMLVSIRERTVELGIRRAIGARPIDIAAQILVESEIMTIMAGMSGITLAVAILGAAEPLIRKSSEIDAQFQVQFPLAASVAAALLVFGALAGVFPAMRALAIKPVDAMRDE